MFVLPTGGCQTDLIQKNEGAVQCGYSATRVVVSVLVSIGSVTTTSSTTTDFLDGISPHLSVFALSIGLWLSYGTVHLNSPMPDRVISFPICSNVCK